MKKIILSCLAVLTISLFSTVVFAVTQDQALEIVNNHLIRQGYSAGQTISLLQETEKSFVLMKEYVSYMTYANQTGTVQYHTEHPCHAVVAVDKKSGQVITKNKDRAIHVRLAYADTFPLVSKKMYLVCAD